MRFDTWYVRILHRSGSLATVARELARYKLDLVDVQEDRWDKAGSVNGKGNEDLQLGTGVFYTTEQYQ